MRSWRSAMQWGLAALHARLYSSPGREKASPAWPSEGRALLCFGLGRGSSGTLMCVLAEQECGGELLIVERLGSLPLGEVMHILQPLIHLLALLAVRKRRAGGTAGRRQDRSPLL